MSIKKHINLFTDKTFVKFVLVGMVNTLIGTTVMFVFYNVFHLSYWVSSASNYIFGSMVSYLLNKHFTFHYQEKGYTSFCRFTLNILVCYLMAYGIAKPLMHAILSNTSIEVQENVSMAVGMCLFVVFNYLGQRFYTFKKDSIQMCIIVMLLMVFVPVRAQHAITISEVRQTGLHTVEITTVDGEEPEGTVIESPWKPGTFNMTYANKVPCRVVISKGDNILFDSGPYEKKTSGATIRINGNTTALYSDPLNMPYNLKLEKDADLLIRGDDSQYADKHWRLLKDAVSLNTMVGLKVSQLTGMEWTSAYLPCNVMINGDYRGCYLLMESVKRNNKCRIRCDKKTGCIVERDPYWWKEEKYFSSAWYKGGSMYRWTWKHPDDDELTEDVENYVQQYITDMEQGIDNGSYEDYIDVLSWAKWLLAHDILGTRDSGGPNMYFKKHDNTADSRLEMPCIWDFDSSYEVTAGDFSRLHTSANAYFSKLLDSSNKAFAKEYVSLWNNLKDDVVSQLVDYINTYMSSDDAASLDASRKLHNRRWNTTYRTVEKDAKIALNWLDRHISLLDQNIQKIDTESAGIQTQTYSTNEGTQQYYQINGMTGQPLHTNGIVIAKDRSNRQVRKYVNKQKR